MSVYARFTYTVRRHLEGSILLKWVIWHVTFFFACRAQDMLSDKIKGKSALKARTFLHEREKVHVCYWSRLSIYIYRRKTVQAQIFYKTLHWRNVYLYMYKKHMIHRNSSAMVINMVTDIKQTCLGQVLGVTFTPRKRPSKLMFTMKDLGHTLPGHQN